jgi:hypothetical protein
MPPRRMCCHIYVFNVVLRWKSPMPSDGGRNLIPIGWWMSADPGGFAPSKLGPARALRLTDVTRVTCGADGGV